MQNEMSSQQNRLNGSSDELYTYTYIYTYLLKNG